MTNPLIDFLNNGLSANYTDRVVEVIKLDGRKVSAVVECPESKIREVCTLLVGVDGSVDFYCEG